MKPLKGEIVKGNDKNGKPFTEATVTGNSSSSSTVKLPDGRQTTADHNNIRGQMDPDS